MGHCGIVKLLLFQGASLEVEGARFQTAARTARVFRQEAILELLEEHTYSVTVLEETHL